MQDKIVSKRQITLDNDEVNQAIREYINRNSEPKVLPKLVKFETMIESINSTTLFLGIKCTCHSKKGK